MPRVMAWDAAPLSRADIVRHKGILENGDLQAAYDYLLGQFQRPDTDTRPVTGAIEGVKIYDRGWNYLFAWQVYPGYLRFYVRRPVLDLKPGLHSSAIANHGDGSVSQNTRNETKIKLSSLKDAKTLVSWLVPHLPLDIKPRRRAGRRNR